MSKVWSGRWRGLTLGVTRPDAGGAHGPALHVGSADGRLEWLRFECSPEDPHVVFDPDGSAERRPLDGADDPITEAFERLAAEPAALLARAGVAAETRAALEPDGATDGVGETGTTSDAATLLAAERALRHRPAVLDALDLRALRARRSEKWHTYPADVLPAWVAEMDFPIAAPIGDRLRRFVDVSDVGYPLGLRETGLAEVFCERMAERFDWRPDPARVEILSEVVQGMYVALEAFSEPGDGIVVQTPIYPPFLGSVRDTGRRLVENRMRLEDGRMVFDLDALEESIDPDCRMLLFCNPHNPSGRVLPREALERIARLAIERDLVVVSDEIHADLVFDDQRHVPFASLGEEIARRTVTLTSVSKAFNVPGLRTAIAHFGDAALQERFDTVIPRHARGGIGLYGIHASIAAWRFGQPWLDEVVPYLAGNRDFVAEALAERLPEVTFVRPEATYLAWLDCRGLALETRPAAHFLRHGRVALSAGHLFGEGWEGFARLNLGTSRAILGEIVDRMAKAVGR